MWGFSLLIGLSFGGLVPLKLLVIWALFNGRLDDIEIGRDIKIAWREQGVVTNMHYLALIFSRYVR